MLLKQKLGAKVLPTRSGHPQQNFRPQASHGLNSLARSYSKGEGQWHGIFSVCNRRQTRMDTHCF